MSKFGIDLETLYRETGNPLYVWAALANYQLCPDGAPLPTWIMSYIRETAMAFELMADIEQPNVAVNKVNAALGLTATGNNNAFAEYRRIARASNAAFIDDHRKEIFVRKGKPEKASVSRHWIAKHTGGTSDRTIRNWIKLIRQLKAARARQLQLEWEGTRQPVPTEC
jgi:hypothetical protein